MALKLRLSKRTVDALEAPRDGDSIVWDSELTGFGVRVSATGRKTFLLKRRTKAGRQIKKTLGAHGDITVEQARTAAGEIIARMTAGADPSAEQRQLRAAEEARLRMLTVGELGDKYLLKHAERRKRPRSIAQDRAMIERIIKRQPIGAAGRPLGDLLVPDVRHADIVELHEALATTPYMANRTVALLSKMFALAVKKWEMRSDNPVPGIERYPEQRRQRFLSQAEFSKLVEALAATPFQITANAIRMLLLTGARRGEVLGMSWEQVEAEPGVWVKPAHFTKQKEIHRVPLSPAALTILESMQTYRKPGELYVFPGRGPGEHLVEIKKTWASVCKAAGITGVRIHDLRHSYASILASHGMSLPLIGALLGHTQPQTTQRYAHLLDDPLREATGRVGALFSAVANGRKAEILPAKRG